MNRKKIIQIIVIAAAFAGSGLVLYNGFKGDNASAPVSNLGGAAGANPLNGVNGMGGRVNGGGAAGKNIDKILPNGDTLDFSVLKRPNVNYDILTLPKLDPKREVGIDESLLIIPLPKQKNDNGGLLKSP